MTNKSPFSILGDQSTPPNTGRPAEAIDASLPLNDRIKSLIQSSPVFLFMKGEPAMPQCGFSANVVGILNHLGVSFKTFDILSDMDIRQGLKEYSNWPTFPQLYINGELMGGNDIVMEMLENGELQNILKESNLLA
jgi:monothiol glutaredoxin